MARRDFSTQRLFVADGLAAAKSVTLPPDQAHYVLNVLRMRPGAPLLLFNGHDGEWRAQIAEASKKLCRLTVKELTREQTSPCDLHYLFAPLKRARLDYMVQKVTEMGVSLLQPVMTARTVAERLNLDRLKANVVEAAEQCGILSVPQVAAPLKLAAMLEGWDPARRLILCDEDAPLQDPIAALAAVEKGPLAVLIGPEGGFDPAEREMVMARPCVVRVSLGPRILRADTAAVAALALVQAVLGDIGHPAHP